MANRPMKMWIGNLDGTLAGLVIATSKARARAIVGAGRREFDDYWVQQQSVNESLRPGVLYTRPMDSGRARDLPWLARGARTIVEAP